MEEIGTYNKGGPSKTKNAPEEASKKDQIAEDEAKMAMQKADWLKRQKKSCDEDKEHGSADKDYWEPGWVTAMKPGLFLDLGAGLSQRQKKCKNRP